MNQALSTETDTLWQEIAPHLDAALGELSEPDRDAVLLRYFERKSAREMAQAFHISDEAAQKRVTRAVERLREFLVKRGITVGANGLVVLITTNAIQVAPAGLIATISTATLAAPALCSTITATAPQAIAMTTLQKTIIATVLTAAIGTGVYQGAENSKLRDHVQTLEQQQALNVDTANQLATLQAENESLKSTQTTPEPELLKLRSEVARLRDAASRALRAEAEAAELKSALQSREGSTTTAVAPDPSTSTLFAFLGEAVPPPPNLDPAYSKDGLLNAVQQAAQLAGVTIKRVEVDTSEFPFLLCVACDTEADYKKFSSQFKNMPNYEYGGGTGSHGACAFSIIPYRTYPSDAAQRITRRTMLRTQVFFNQLRQN